MPITFVQMSWIRNIKRMWSTVSISIFNPVWLLSDFVDHHGNAVRISDEESPQVDILFHGVYEDIVPVWKVRYTCRNFAFCMCHQLFAFLLNTEH